MTWDEGWVGKHVNSPGNPHDDPARPMTVHESDDAPLLFVEMNGEKFRIMRSTKVGF